MRTGPGDETGTPEPVMVLDASLLIAFLDAEDLHHDAAVTLLQTRADDELAVATLTLAEVLVGPVRQGRDEIVRLVLDDLELVELPLPRGSARRLAELRGSTRLRLPDCCVLLAALDVGGDVATFDDQLARAARSLGVTVLAGA